MSVSTPMRGSLPRDNTSALLLAVAGKGTGVF